MKRKTRGAAIAAALSRMRLNIAIFALFVVLAVVGGVALRDTLLQNAYETNTALSRSYASEIDSNLVTYEALLEFGTTSIEQRVYDDSPWSSLEEWASLYCDRIRSVLGDDTINVYGVVDGKVLDASGSIPDAAVDASQHLYVDISATEMAGIWQEVWRYGVSGEAGSEELGSYLSRTEHSPIGTTLRDGCEVWSKPGWYPDDSYNLSASNDAGVVFADEGDYVLVILTDIGDNTDALIPLVEALDASHASMCGDELVEV